MQRIPCPANARFLLDPQAILAHKTKVHNCFLVERHVAIQSATCTSVLRTTGVRLLLSLTGAPGEAS